MNSSGNSVNAADFRGPGRAVLRMLCAWVKHMRCPSHCHDTPIHRSRRVTTPNLAPLYSGRMGDTGQHVHRNGAPAGDAGTAARAVSQADISTHLERLLASEGLAKAAANRRLLSYLAQRATEGSEGPKETEIAIDVFGRTASFHGGDDSVVRVAMRSLRQKLLEYYAGPGRHDRLVFDIPKGSYRLQVSARDAADPAADMSQPPRSDALAANTPAAAPTPVVAPASGAPPATTRTWRRVAAIAGALLLVSLAANVRLWRSDAGADPALDNIRGSALWNGIATSRRPVMFVLGDLFMYTQTDPVTGRVQTVRDPQINSSDDLRAFLAGHPQLAAERGLRYASYIQKSTAVAMATILPIVDRPGRRFEVRLRDELRAEDMRVYDIVYVGPMARVGPLEINLHGASRFRFDAQSAGVTDTETGRVHLPEGDLADHHKDYALVTRSAGPAGNHILIITAGGRNAGLAQVVHMATSAAGLTAFQRRFREAGIDASTSFEALVSVTGFKQTDVAAEILTLRRLAGIAAPATAQSR